MIICMFKLHILLFYKAKSSILNIHDIQSYSYANCICESEYTFNKYIHRLHKIIVKIYLYVSKYDIRCVALM